MNDDNQMYFSYSIGEVPFCQAVGQRRHPDKLRMVSATSVWEAIRRWFFVQQIEPANFNPLAMSYEGKRIVVVESTDYRFEDLYQADIPGALLPEVPCLLSNRA